MTVRPRLLIVVVGLLFLFLTSYYSCLILVTRFNSICENEELQQICLSIAPSELHMSSASVTVSHLLALQQWFVATFTAVLEHSAALPPQVHLDSCYFAIDVN